MMPLLAIRDLTLRRFAAPAYGADRRPVRAAPVDTVIRGSVQPVGKTERQAMPEGVRGLRMTKVITYTEVQAGTDETPSDHYLIDGVEYVVHSSLPHPPFFGQPAHWETVGIEQTHRRVTP